MNKKKIKLVVYGTKKENEISRAVFRIVLGDEKPKKIDQINLIFAMPPFGCEKREKKTRIGYEMSDTNLRLATIFIHPSMNKKMKTTTIAHEFRHVIQDNSWSKKDADNNLRCENDAYSYERAIEKLL